MGTNVYLNEELRDVVSGAKVSFNVGTTGHGGTKLYLKIGREELVLSDEDAAKFCGALAGVADYLSLPDRRP
jgi:hypothetical protein